MIYWIFELENLISQQSCSLNQWLNNNSYYFLNCLYIWMININELEKI